MKFLLSILLFLLAPQAQVLLAAAEENVPPSSDWVNLEEGDEVGRYFLKGGIIHVHVNGMIEEPLKDADPVSFRANTRFSEFGRDKSHAWYIDVKLGVDMASWQIFSQSYSKDLGKVYCGARELPDADPATFKLLDEGILGLAEWGADKNSVYSQWFKLKNSDPKTFQFIDDSFSKDRNNVYHDQHLLEGADPASFKVIATNVGKDKKAIYAFGRKMPDYIDLPSVTVPGDGYIYDKNGRYHLERGQWVKTER